MEDALSLRLSWPNDCYFYSLFNSNSQTSFLRERRKGKKGGYAQGPYQKDYGSTEHFQLGKGGFAPNYNYPSFGQTHNYNYQQLSQNYNHPSFAPTTLSQLYSNTNGFTPPRLEGATAVPTTPAFGLAPGNEAEGSAAKRARAEPEPVDPFRR